MRARRPDYTASGPLIDIPYRLLDLDEHLTAAGTRPPTIRSVVVPECRNPHLDRILTANSKVSALSKVSNLANKNLCPERNPLLVPGNVSTQIFKKEQITHVECKSCTGIDSFVQIDNHDNKSGGKYVAPHSPNCLPIPIRGEYGKPQCSEQYLKAVDGGFSLLQRQSSGSSFVDSLFSSDVPFSNVSPTISFSDGDLGLIGTYLDDICKQDEAAGAMQEYSWAQQTEQSYNLQLALALRLVAEAGLSEGPLFLPCYTTENRQIVCSAGANSVQTTAFRFWVNGGLSYADRLNDGFYHIWGMNPHVWALCNNPVEGDGRMPKLNTLKRLNPVQNAIEVVVVDKHGDSRLCAMENQAFNVAFKAAGSKDLAELLGKLVSQNMGGTATSEQELISRWQTSSLDLKKCLNSVVLPIGSISVGLCRHRSLLFKLVTDFLIFIWGPGPCHGAVESSLEESCLEEGGFEYSAGFASPSDVPLAWGEVRDQEVLVFFDPGACANFISPELASKLGIRAEEMDMTCKAGLACLGHSEPATPMLGKLCLHIQSYVDADEFHMNHIMLLPDCYVLLDIPWCYMLHAVVDTFHKRITLVHRGKTHVLDSKLKGEYLLV
ncbi:hypothetical protein L7F22_052513 [Adiantum nelumboides]|nr:hypothetical protein [Adiantum nelumboides]